MKKLNYFIFLIICPLVIHSQEYTLTHDGITRTYRLHLPVNFSPDSLYPLVINMHGLGSNAWEQEIYSAFNPVSDTGRFIVAYPNGLNSTWNVSSSGGTDDVGFISALIDTLSVLYNVDLQRVYATGMSMGGFMSYRLACELSDRITAIASVTGLLAFSPCMPSRPVPVAQFHGTDDPVVPYAGVASTINYWISTNQCPDSAIVTDLPNIDTTDNSTVILYDYSPCTDSASVLLYSIINGEHTWPGADILIGVTNQDIEASNEIWNFFTRFTLQGPVSIDENEPFAVISLDIFPNPVEGLATVDISGLESDGFIFRLMDINGRVCKEQNNFREKRFLLDASLLPAGLYLAQIVQDRNIVVSTKLMIR